MAKKISQLTQATEVKSDDVTVIVQDGETKKLPLNMMVTKQDIENKKVTGLAKLDEIEATYENDTYTPTITVKNKSSVKVGEGDGVDYSANVMDGPAKSAILKGQTLVNLSSIKDEIINSSNTGKKVERLEDIIKPNTRYICFVDIKSSNKLSNISSNQMFRVENDGKPIGGISGDIFTHYTRKYFKFTTGSSKTIIFVMRNAYHDTSIGLTENTLYIKNVVLLEYQEGMENWDIPYFEGMQSVKMPVLTTTGKNLADINNSTTNNIDKIYIPCYLVKGNNYTITTNVDYSGRFISIQTINDEEVQIISNWGVNNKQFTFNGETGKYLLLIWRGSLISEYPNIQVQLEQGLTETSYEPYKTNILTVNEPVELRGIGEVRDTLNCLTGEVTQRVGEVIIDGSQTLNNERCDDENYYRVSITVAGLKIKCNTINNLLPTQTAVTNDTTGEYVGSHISSNNIHIRILSSKLSERTNEGVKQFLQSNPITLQYQLATESIKTVDLIPSGTHPSTTPYCWKDGHIQLSSSGLLPSLEYSVVTSRAGQISQNAAMIVKNDKRIFDLEILLAGGLVNTTYQALTLQNQVETGLSKVSLSSEKEPDYLLYHMIMKLIEEKAYKLDDLAEKVSVFYLYEKLSDEQFETIYAALYPFVEDEYDELPEEAENEVVM